MNIASMSLPEFLVQRGPTHPTPIFGAEYLTPYLAMVGPLAKDLGLGYAIHETVYGQGDMMLVHEGKLVGIYSGEAVFIEPSHQGKGLSVPLVIMTNLMRPAPTSRSLSVAGLKSLTAAWEVIHCKRTSPWWP